jgi:hypothetical protein
MPLFTINAGTPSVPAGTYPATLISITPKRMASQFADPPGSEQDVLEWTWLVEGPEKDVEITSLTSYATSPKSNIRKYLVALIGAEKATAEGTGFDEADLVGKKVMVGVVVADNGFSKIDTVVAAPRGRQAAAAAAPAAAPSVQAPEDDLPF